MVEEPDDPVLLGKVISFQNARIELVSFKRLIFPDDAVDNVVFLRVEVLESGETRQIAKELNITKFPTYQYWKVRARSHGPIKRPNRAPHQFNSLN